MVETRTGHDRSDGISYTDLLETDSVRAPETFFEESPMEPGVTKVATKRFYSQEEHDLEVERLWKRVWQMACHEDDIPNVGDTHVYDIAGLSFIIIRTGKQEFKAFPNACMHRGRALCDTHKKGLTVLRCPFHGWMWSLEGQLREVPCQWDFPTVTAEEYSLQPVNVGRWGGFVFINPDPNCEPLEDFLGDFDRHFQVPFSRRYKAAHLVKKLRCNWKIAQDAFMESYHVIGTHPELLPTFSDANSKYDVWGNYSRALSASGPPSPHTDLENPDSSAFPDGKFFQSFRHPTTGHLFERLEENRVKVTSRNGKSGIFDMNGDHIEGELTAADQHMCNWIGGKLREDSVDMPAAFATESPQAYRTAHANFRREQMRPLWGDEVDKISEADLTDAIFYSLFPNLSPWGDYNPIFYRFLPYGNNPEECIHEVMYMVPLPEGADRPEPAACTYLDFDDDYTQAPDFTGFLLKIFNQDNLNHEMVQKGMRNQSKGEIILASYQESKLRHFYETLDKWLESEEAPRSK
ncbi:MAG: aromatic ring-hydroxylating dioxygenase subunit alpha [Henriciella sp.]